MVSKKINPRNKSKKIDPKSRAANPPCFWFFAFVAHFFENNFLLRIKKIKKKKPQKDPLFSALASRQLFLLRKKSWLTALRAKKRGFFRLFAHPFGAGNAAIGAAAHFIRRRPDNRKLMCFGWVCKGNFSLSTCVILSQPLPNFILGKKSPKPGSFSVVVLIRRQRVEKRGLSFQKL